MRMGYPSNEMPKSGKLPNYHQRRLQMSLRTALARIQGEILGRETKVKRRLALLTIMAFTLLLSGCMVKPISEPKVGGGFDLNMFIRNPIVMGIIIIVVLWFMFRKK